ncbi:hypothetical protein EU538_00410 [Candidatus Thorarchaeota archaeon]|nr:MAG: hypothetical protein EU538_00410 [Candidatus Thorarchaeota archaeon]
MGRLKTLTKGRLTEVRDGHLLLGSFASDMDIDDGSSVLVIGTKSRFLRVIGVDRDLVVLIRVSFSLEGFTESAKEVFSEIKSRSIAMVHSTGFCPFEDSCVWEGYFSPEPKDNIEELARWIEKRPSVLGVEIERLTGDFGEA